MTPSSEASGSAKQRPADQGGNALAHFHPLVRAWFEAEVGAPTDVQQQSWPAIARDEHVLVTAPTGSGKTLTAFLWALDGLVTGTLASGATRVLYISPLKALNSDIQRNLLAPLAGLRERFEAAGQTMPSVRVQTRSGDTPQSERQRMLRSPPEILITTPESLNLLLTTRRGRAALTEVAGVILDEVHAVVANRRGVQLITALERLTELSGEFQRIALSATVEPMARVASWLGGYRRVATDHYVPRPVTQIRSRATKALELVVRFPEAAVAGRATGVPVWEPVSEALRDTITGNRSTLVFTNNRRLTEKLTALVNEPLATPLAYAHHGSLSREIRGAVESQLKAGKLRGIIATSSLEMGIDIGSLDRVVLINTPPTVAGALQRIGRAGHQVGETSRATLIPTHGHDFLAAAALSGAVAARDIEPVQPLVNALDVLAQLIISMTASEPWQADDLYDLLRCSGAYHTLSRQQFDLVVEMLTGRYADSRIRDLKPKIALDRDRGTISARRGAVLSLYAGGGTIPDRGYYQLRHRDTGAKIGELDEEFVWEARIGQVFNLGSQYWQVSRITHNDVFVAPGRPAGTAPPFWRADTIDRRAHLSIRVAEWLERAEATLAHKPERGRPDGATVLQQTLTREHHFDATAARELLDYLDAQRAHTGTALPHRHHLVAETITSGPGGYRGPERLHQVALHTCWGGTLNRPYALALVAAWEARTGDRLETHIGNDALVIHTRSPVDPDDLIATVTPDNVETWLRQSLERSAYFGARFRECAGRALLLAPKRFNQRQPLWITRLEAKKLMANVARYEDFPILLETWRTCLVDEFELADLRARLAELTAGEIAVTHTTTDSPSPFASQLAFDQISTYMYADDSPDRDAPSSLADGLIRAATLEPGQRPQIAPATVREYERKRQRLADGYSPTTGQELVEWLKERVLLPAAEFDALLKAIERDRRAAGHSSDATGDDDILRDAAPALCSLTLTDSAAGALPTDPNAGTPVRTWWLARENLSLVLREFNVPPAAWALGNLPGDPSALAIDEIAASTDTRELPELLGEWLVFYGPRTLAQLAAALPLSVERLGGALRQLADDDQLICGHLIEPPISEPGAAAGPDDELPSWCDVEVFGTLLRIARAAARPQLAPQPATALPSFLAHWQGFAAGQPTLADAVQGLAGLVGAAGLWESEWLPARIAAYSAHHLDALLREGEIYWLGAGVGQLTLVGDEERLLWSPDPVDPAPGSASNDVEPPIVTSEDESSLDTRLPFADAGAHYSFSQLADLDGADTAAFSARWWTQVWAGAIVSDDFAPIRRGLALDFKLPAAGGGTGSSSGGRRRARSSNRRAAAARAIGWPGMWHRVPPLDDAPLDPLEALELNKDRARLLLDRYGIVTRELLAREVAPLRFARLLRALLMMELAGEVTSGLFFEGLSGPQFATPAALREFAQQASSTDVHDAGGPTRAGAPPIFWLNATDPISPCGMGSGMGSSMGSGIRSGIRSGTGITFRIKLPRRLPGNHLSFRGADLLVVSESRGKRLTIAAPPDDPDLPRLLAPITHLLTRDVNAHSRLMIETINQVPVAQSEYLPILAQLFTIERDHRAVYLTRTPNTVPVP